ncbi:acyltransferase [uncultured Massilia sp.]|uniref:acyltransferase family protein n=1 Tax=uncultured Massilia sp. TaxID=169973 RepID=UPI0025E20069|nr:acyltransferase [uncultured Massilia sp.]
MLGIQLPSIRCQRHSQPAKDTVHSMLISLMRGLAALQVAAAHLRAEIFPGLRELADPPLAYQLLAFATAFSHQAVVVFFLISGWLVGGSLLDKLGQPGALRGYAIDRVTRLWTVLLPALLLMLAIGGVTGAVDPSRADLSAANPYSIASFAGNLFGLQTVLVEPYAGNYALWSLSNETWYYIQFPLLLLVFAGRGRLVRIGSATALVLVAATLPFPITLYFLLWLLGAAFSRIRIDCGNVLRAALLGAAVAVAVYFRLKGTNDDLKPASFFQHLCYSVPLLALLASLQVPLALRTRPMHWLARMAHVLSECSFTLYVMHIPLIALMRYAGARHLGRDTLSPHAAPDYAIYGGMLLAIAGASWLCWWLFESRTGSVRRAIKAALRVGAGNAAMQGITEKATERATERANERTTGRATDRPRAEGRTTATGAPKREVAPE